MSRKARVSDKDRIDWLHSGNVRVGANSCHKYTLWVPNVKFPGTAYFGGRTLRQAIDAAIRAERRAGRGK